MSGKERSQVRVGGGRWVAVLLLSMAVGACSDSDSTGKEEGGAGHASGTPAIYSAEKAGCGLFTREDAAAVLGVPAAEVTVDSQELYAGNWNCSFTGGGMDQMVNFNLSLSESSDEAARDMAQYRSHLETARGVKPFKDDAGEGPYSEVAGLGDEALWTGVNSTLAVRKGNLSLQISLPQDRSAQEEVARRFLSRL